MLINAFHLYTAGATAMPVSVSYIYVYKPQGRTLKKQVMRKTEALETHFLGTERTVITGSNEKACTQNISVNNTVIKRNDNKFRRKA
jgi:hypothetical protein